MHGLQRVLGDHLRVHTLGHARKLAGCSAYTVDDGGGGRRRNFCFACQGQYRFAVDRQQHGLARFVDHVRGTDAGWLSAQSLLASFPLASAEGVALLRLAEALLRVPDPETQTWLIAEKLASFRDARAGGGDALVQRVLATALRIAGQVNPDLVLMDIQLADKMRGTEAAEHLKKQMDVPVIFLTAYCDENVLEQAEKSFPHGYLIKPFDRRELEASIRMALINLAEGCLDNMEASDGQ